MSLDISLLLLIIFLLFILVICLYSSNRKATNFREYAVGHGQFATAAIVATIIASHCPGGLLKACIGDVYAGTWYIAHRMSITLLPLLTLSWLASRMSKFIYTLSMPGTMGNVYGSNIRWITALFEVCNGVIIVSLQIRVISDTVSLFTNLAGPLVMTIPITVVLVAYAMFGGIRAIAFSDVWQCIISSTLIAILAWLIFKKTDKSIIEIIDCLQAQKKFQLHDIISTDGKVPNMLRYLSNLFIAISPYLVQSVYICYSPAQARRAFLYAGIFSSVIVAAITVVGLLVFVWLPNVPSQEIWVHFFAKTSPFLKGLVCVIMLSFAMSTVDSRLHVASIMLAYDMPKSIPFFRKLVHGCQLRVARIALLAMALLTLVLAFNLSISMLVDMLVWYGRFYVPIIMPPFILAVLGYRMASPAAEIGMTIGLLSVFAWQKWFVPIVGTSSGHVPGMLLNGLAMCIAHYLLPKTPTRGTHLKARWFVSAYATGRCRTKQHEK